MVKQAQWKAKKSIIGSINYGWNDDLLLDDTEKGKFCNDYCARIGEDLAGNHAEIREENLQQYIVRVTPTTEEIQISQAIVRERLRLELVFKESNGA